MRCRITVRGRTGGMGHAGASASASSSQGRSEIGGMQGEGPRGRIGGCGPPARARGHNDDTKAGRQGRRAEILSPKGTAAISAAIRARSSLNAALRVINLRTLSFRTTAEEDEGRREDRGLSGLDARPSPCSSQGAWAGARPGNGFLAG